MPERMTDPKTWRQESWRPPSFVWVLIVLALILVAALVF